MHKLNRNQILLIYLSLKEVNRRGKYKNYKSHICSSFQIYLLLLLRRLIRTIIRKRGVRRYFIYFFVNTEQ